VTFYFNALTVIDPVTNLLELYRLPDKTAYRVGQSLQNGWFARCPRPQRCVYDQGNEFLGLASQQVLRNAGVKNSSRFFKIRRPCKVNSNPIR